MDAASRSGSIPEVLFFAFQMTFAIITPRSSSVPSPNGCAFSAVLAFSALWLSFVYAPVCHMVWAGEGALLADLGVRDFAGGLVVHLTAGVAALVACLYIGPRRGYPTAPIFPPQPDLTVAGTGMLWVGWFGFNGGSALAADATAAMAITVTHISAAVAALTWIGIEWLRHGKPSALGLATGAIAGLAAVTPASGFVGPTGFAIGFASGVLCYWASISLKRHFGYDDSLDVFGVHGVGGVVGTLLVAFFAAESLGGAGGELGMARQFAVQLGAVVFVALYTAAATAALLAALGAVMSLRVDPQEETEGIDLALHDEVGYRL